MSESDEGLELTSWGKRLRELRDKAHAAVAADEQEGDFSERIVGYVESAHETLDELANYASAMGRKLHEHHASKNQAYTERNVLVALLARLFPSGIRPTAIEGWNPDWNNCVYIDLPSGQVSFHYHDKDAALFKELPPYTQPYDGHSKEDAMARIQACFDDHLIRN